MAQLQATTVTGTITSTGFTGAAGTLTGVSVSQFTTGNFPAAYMPAGSVVATTHFSNNTRTVTSSTATYKPFSFTVNKLLSSSILVIEGTVQWYGNGDTPANAAGIAIDNSWNYTGLHYNTNMTGAYGTANHGCVHINQARTGISSGTRTIEFGWNSANGSAIRLFQVLNPNSTDDSRNQQTGIQLHVWEIAQ